MKMNRCMVAFLVVLVWSAGGAISALPRKPPRSLVFPSAKAGDVTFNHQAHIKRLNNACSTCHDRLWPQSAKVPVKSSDGCGTCHRADGKSFEMKGNCTRCHAKPDDPPSAPR